MSNAVVDAVVDEAAAGILRCVFVRAPFVHPSIPRWCPVRASLFVTFLTILDNDVNVYVYYIGMATVAVADFAHYLLGKHDKMSYFTLQF